MMAFMGVRMSWDILERKVVLAWLALWACIRASCRARVCSRCFCTWAVMSLDTTMTMMSPVALSRFMMKDWRTHMGCLASPKPQ